MKVNNTMYDNLIESTENYINGFQILEIKSGTFSGIRFTYGKVAISESESLEFEYNIIDDTDLQKTKIYDKLIKDNLNSFVKILGDKLMMLIEEMLKKSEVVYTGGV